MTEINKKNGKRNLEYPDDQSNSFIQKEPKQVQISRAGNDTADRGNNKSKKSTTESGESIKRDQMLIDSEKELISNMKNLIEENFKELKDLRKKKAMENIELHKQELRLHESKLKAEIAENKEAVKKIEYTELVRLYPFSLKQQQGQMKAKTQSELLDEFNLLKNKERVLKSAIPKLQREYKYKKTWSQTGTPIIFSPAIAYLNMNYYHTGMQFRFREKLYEDDYEQSIDYLNVSSREHDIDLAKAGIITSEEQHVSVETTSENSIVQRNDHDHNSTTDTAHHDFIAASESQSRMGYEDKSIADDECSPQVRPADADSNSVTANDCYDAEQNGRRKSFADDGYSNSTQVKDEALVKGKSLVKDIHAIPLSSTKDDSQSNVVLKNKQRSTSEEHKRHYPSSSGEQKDTHLNNKVSRSVNTSSRNKKNINQPSAHGPSPRSRRQSPNLRLSDIMDAIQNLNPVTVAKSSSSTKKSKIPVPIKRTKSTSKTSEKAKDGSLENSPRQEDGLNNKPLPLESSSAVQSNITVPKQYSGLGAKHLKVDAISKVRQVQKIHPQDVKENSKGKVRYSPHLSPLSRDNNNGNRQKWLGVTSSSMPISSNTNQGINDSVSGITNKQELREPKVSINQRPNDIGYKLGSTQKMAMLNSLPGNAKLDSADKTVMLKPLKENQKRMKRTVISEREPKLLHRRSSTENHLVSSRNAIRRTSVAEELRKLTPRNASAILPRITPAPKKNKIKSR